MIKTGGTYLRKTRSWLLGLPTAQLIALALVGTYVAAVPSILYSLLLAPGQTIGGPDLGKHDVFKMLVVGCIAAPLIETAVHQWGCLWLLKKLRCKARIAIGISALLFGLSHNYSGTYILMGVLSGAVLAMVFVIEDTRNGRPFLATWAVHSLRNGITAGITLYVL